MMRQERKRRSKEEGWKDGWKEGRKDGWMMTEGSEELSFVCGEICKG